MAFDIHQKKKIGEESIIIVVSPLISLIMDQVSSLSKRGISIGYITAETRPEMKTDILQGKCSIVMTIPETIVGKWRHLLSSPIYKRRLVGLIIDEAHCVVSWYV